MRNLFPSLLLLYRFFFYLFEKTSTHIISSSSSSRYIVRYYCTHHRRRQRQSFRVVELRNVRHNAKHDDISPEKNNKKSQEIKCLCFCLYRRIMNLYKRIFTALFLFSSLLPPKKLKIKYFFILF